MPLLCTLMILWHPCYHLEYFIEIINKFTSKRHEVFIFMVSALRFTVVSILSHWSSSAEELCPSRSRLSFPGFPLGLFSQDPWCCLFSWTHHHKICLGKETSTSHPRWPQHFWTSLIPKLHLKEIGWHSKRIIKCQFLGPLETARKFCSESSYF